MEFFFTLLAGIPFPAPPTLAGWFVWVSLLGLTAYALYRWRGYQPEWKNREWGLFVAFLILIPFHSIYILIISVLVLTLSEMLAMPFMSTYSLLQAKDKNMGDYMALYAMSWSLALIIAPLIGTQIINHFGFSMLWLFVSVLGFVSLIGIYKLGQKQQV